MCMFVAYYGPPPHFSFLDMQRANLPQSNLLFNVSITTGPSRQFYNWSFSQLYDRDNGIKTLLDTEYNGRITNYYQALSKNFSRGAAGKLQKNGAVAGELKFVAGVDAYAEYCAAFRDYPLYVRDEYRTNAVVNTSANCQRSPTCEPDITGKIVFVHHNERCWLQEKGIVAFMCVIGLTPVLKFV